jgi:hypothetical protein
VRPGGSQPPRSRSRRRCGGKERTRTVIADVNDAFLRCRAGHLVDGSSGRARRARQGPDAPATAAVGGDGEGKPPRAADAYLGRRAGRIGVLPRQAPVIWQCRDRPPGGPPVGGPFRRVTLSAAVPGVAHRGGHAVKAVRLRPRPHVPESGRTRAGRCAWRAARGRPVVRPAGDDERDGHHGDDRGRRRERNQRPWPAPPAADRTGWSPITASSAVGQVERRDAARGDLLRRSPDGGPHPGFERVHEFSLSRRPSATSARWVVDRTVPWLMPMTRAISASGSSR